MTGEAPINVPCPHCGVFPVDGYMSHRTDCPERQAAREERLRRYMCENPPSQPPFWAPGHVGWRSELRDAIVWWWRGINWMEVTAVVIACVVGVVILFACLYYISGEKW